MKRIKTIGMKNVRTKNSVKNIVIGLIGQAFNIVVNFISRTIFIYILGVSYLGINGLFTNILSMLSLAELGVGSAIIYHMYKPLATKDENRLKSLMKLYSKTYKIIGIVVALLGISIVPFLNNIIKDKPNVPHLTIIYLLFLTNSVVSYFFAYKVSIINADQKSYIVTIKQQIYSVIQILGQIIVLLMTKNYLLYLLVQILCTFLFNLSISRKADELYPFLKSKDIEPLDAESKKTIFKHVAAMMSHKVGGVVVNGTDNILISSFVGVYWVGLYSNYVMILETVNKFLNQIFISIIASVGNLNAQETKQKSYDVYKKLLFLDFWIYSFSAICLWLLLNPFIEMWIGSKFVMQNSIITIVVINFYLKGMRQATVTYNTTLGLFWNDRFKPWAEALINLVASIILLKKLGIAGVFWGTFISTVTTSLWIEPYILFKHGFNKKINKYIIKYTYYTFVMLISAIVTKYISMLVTGNIVVCFIIKLIICIIVPNIIFILFCFKMNEFKYFKKLFIKILVKKQIIK